MTFKLFRVYGKQEWQVFGASNKGVVEAYAKKYVAQTGSLWKVGTRFEIRTVEVLGYINDGELTPDRPLVFV